ncbi:MAG TPA: ShlB/FhaC/HecB family hemolysin secretion/activation protein [Gemmatimonadaceae bacterium]
MPMFLTALLASSVALQVPVDVKKDTTKKATYEVTVGGRRRRDTITVVKDSTDTLAAISKEHPWRYARRLPVTARVLATAFHDHNARLLLERARESRLSQDSALLSYDATAYQRISAGMGFARIGRDRLIFRTENVSRVRWQRGIGAWIDVKGQRTAIPVAPKEAQEDAERDMAEEADMAAIPYYPGYEALWIGAGSVRGSVDERQFVHPLATGSEAYYLYESGDSIDIHLPDKSTVKLRELRVRPREPKWNLVVGSLWFDTKSGQLVRAAYRFAAPLDVWSMVKEEDPHSMDDVPKWVMPMISPMHAQISAIAIEYGLYETRFWLPRIRAAEGSAQVSFMHVPFKFEQSFKYASVNAIDTLPGPVVVANQLRLDTLPDSVAERMRDSLRAQRRARRDSVKAGLLKAPVDQCDTSAFRIVRHTENWREGVELRTAYRVPCDLKKLANSPDLPGSIFDPGEEVFGAKERDALIAEALSIGAQPPFLLGSGHLPPPTLKWGPEFMRYNRVEGFSLGGQAEQQLGGGYNARAIGRIGFADFEPNVELTVERTNLEKTYAVTGYNRLVAANDFGNPLSFGSSLSALLFGRDEGFYYRASGVELTRARDPRSDGARIDWRLFFENERSAKQETNFSFGPAFIPNIVASNEQYAGSALHVNHTAGLDPRGARLLTDVRLEAASALSKQDTIWNRYARGAVDLTFSHGLPKQLLGAVTLSGGTSVGTVPAQRLWYLGGAQTVRGQRPDTAQSGNAYWLTRTELAYDAGGFRPSLFGDIGWTGDRTLLYKNQIGRPMSGVGVGTSIMDGLFRFDVARGLYPQQRVRVDMYVEARF